MKKLAVLIMSAVMVFSLAGVAAAAEAPEGYTQVKVFDGTYGFGDAEITVYTNDDFSAFDIEFVCFDEDQILKGTVEDGICNVDYDLTGFVAGDCQLIWDDAMASENPWEAIGGEAEDDAEETEGSVFVLSDLNGTYTELFPVLEQDAYTSLWIEKITEYAGIDEESAELARAILLGMMESDIYGEDAIAEAANDPAYSSFHCYFINGVSLITVADDEISGVDAEGNEVFRHTYSFVDTVKMDMGEEMNELYKDLIPEEEWPVFYVYEAEDADDDFKYFAFAPDTPAETYHIEFRYGASAENIAKYYEGEYAYYMSAGIPADASEEMITDCIDLFVSENAEGISMMFAAPEEAAESAE